MQVADPSFGPDVPGDRDAMVALQRRVARAARFVPGDTPQPDQISLETPIGDDHGESTVDPQGPPLVAGIDQAFDGDQAVSAVIVLQGARVVARATGLATVSVPYIPGLLAFREAPAIVTALRSLSIEPDLLVVDGSGRIHYRQAGLATHLGVLFDCPALGVTKRLLCGSPRASLDTPLPVGSRIPIEADEEVEPRSSEADDPDWPIIGYAYQSRQFDHADRHVNPVYVSPGNEVSAAGAVDLVAALSPRYKLPEPIRLADRAAGRATTDPEG